MNSIIKPNEAAWLAKFRFSTPIRVRFCETDAYGHVNNVSYFIYFEQVRVDYLLALGINQELQNQNDHFIVTADLYCQFLGEVHFGEELTVKVRTAKIGRSSLELEYAIIKEHSQVVAVGRGALVMLERESKNSTPISQDIKEKIMKFENDYSLSEQLN